MRLLRIFGIAALLTALFLGVAFYLYRSIARKQQRELGSALLMKFPDPAPARYGSNFFQRG
jgi:cbb3-type cytochrome oxidase subunit 3